MRTETPSERICGAPSGLSLVLASFRPAFHLAVLGPAWGILECARVAASLPALKPWIGLAFAPFCLLAWAWVSAFAVREASKGSPPRLREVVRAWRRSLASVFLAPMATAVVPALFAAICLAGSAAFLWVPGIGSWLQAIWLWTAAPLLGALSGIWILLGVPALFLQIPAAVAEFPQSFDIVSRSIDYVRRRPLLLFGGGVVVLGAAAFGAACAGVVVSAAAVFANAAAELARGSASYPLDAALAALAIWREPEVWWPAREVSLCFERALPGAEASPWLVPMARVVPAAFAASLACGLARLYLVARREVDGTPIHRVYEALSPKDPR